MPAEVMRPMSTSTVRLRPLRADDLPLLWRWYERPDFFAMLVGHHRRRAEAEAVAHMTRWLTDEPTAVRRAITRRDDGRLLGQVALLDIDPVYGRAELNIFVGESADRRRGYGLAATRAMLAEGFGRLDLHRIDLRVLADNGPARALYRACAFVEEGRLRQAAVKGGGRVDLVVMSLLRTEYGLGQRDDG
jgi:RimJ/RimL family protein N-acetyltransferase